MIFVPIKHFRLLFLCVFFSFSFQSVFGQNVSEDILKLAEEKLQITKDLKNSNFDSTIAVSKELLQLSKRNNLANYEAKALYIMAKAFMYSGQVDSAKSYLPLAKEALIKENDSLLLGKIHSFIARILLDAGQLDSAISEFHKAYDLIPMTKDSIWHVFIVENLGYGYFSAGQFYSSLANFQETLTGIEALNTESKNNDLARVYNNIGLIYRNIRDFKKEKEIYLKIIALLEDDPQNLNRAMAYNNLAEIYFDEKKDSLGLVSLEKAKSVYDSLGYEFGLSGYYQGLYSYYMKTRVRDWNKVVDYTSRSIEISKKYNKSRMMADAYADLGLALMELNRYGEAKEALTHGLEIARKNQLTREQKKLLDNLSELHRKTHQYKTALDYLVEANSIGDSLLNEQKIQNIADIDYRFKYQQQKLQDSILQVSKAQELEFLYDRKLQQQKTNNLIIYFALILVVIISFFIYKSLKRSRAHVQELEEKNLIIQEAMKAKSDFFSKMSHELRSPLNSIIGISNLLKSGNKNPDQLENLEALSFSSNTLFMLINDILDISKIEAGKMTFERVDVNLMILLKNIINIHKASLGNKKVDLKLSVDEDIPTLKLDPMRLGQVLNNLLSNAVKFTDKGSIELLARKENETEHDCTIYFHVKDTGIGIPSESIDKIFESFSQSNNNIKRNFGGTGLGLAITKNILELNGSEIMVKSTSGKGSTFYFSITFAKSVQSELTEELEIPIENQFKIFDHPSILLVEDNPINVLVASQFLKKWNIEYDVAENGKIAVDMMKEKPYDLILMDCMMPVMDGYEATKEIRSFNTQIPILALTASAMPEDKKKIKESGMNDYELKPFDPQQLNSKIAFYLDRQEVNA